MEIVAVLLSTFLVVHGEAFDLKTSLEERIVNGIQPSTKKLRSVIPNMSVLAEIRDPNATYFCNGVVISPQSIMTAAICIQVHVNKPNLGGLLVLIRGSIRDITGCTLTENNKSYFDVNNYSKLAIVTFKPKYFGIKVRPANQIHVDDDVVLLGNNIRVERGQALLNLRVIGKGKCCIKANEPDDETNKEIFCAVPTIFNADGYIEKQDIGSPLFLNKKIAGIVSGNQSSRIDPNSILFVNVLEIWDNFQ